MPSRDLVLVNCLLFDATGGPAVADRGVWLSDGRIEAVGTSDEVLAEAAGRGRIVDLGGDCVLPGLVNMHVHLGLSLPGDLHAAAGGASDAELALLMAGNARRTLHSGVTTVRLVGEARYLDFALRRAIETGAVDGPRIFTAGHALCCTGGHGWDADALEADGADGMRRATRQQLRAGADLIKVCISGGIAGEYESIDTPQLSDAEMAAVIDTAHDWGRQVTAHAGPAPVITRALSLGLDGVEHGYELTAELTAEMARRGTWYVPTIVVSRCEEFLVANGVPSWMIDRALGAGPRHWQSLQHALASGVRIAMGSDMPPHAPYDGTTANVRELEFMVDAGMAPVDALLSATARPAEWLGVADRQGTIELGQRADLIAVRGDPTVDISALRELHLVVKDGRAVRDDHALRSR